MLGPGRRGGRLDGRDRRAGVHVGQLAVGPGGRRVGHPVARDVGNEPGGCRHGGECRARAPQSGGGSGGGGDDPFDGNAVAVARRLRRHQGGPGRVGEGTAGRGAASAGAVRGRGQHGHVVCRQLGPRDSRPRLRAMGFRRPLALRGTASPGDGRRHPGCSLGPVDPRRAAHRGRGGVADTSAPSAVRSIFSMAVRGSSVASTISSGSLYEARRPRAWARRASSVGASPAWRGTTTATPISPMTGSGRGTTATWATPGWSARTFSTSRGKTLYPPRTYISLERPDRWGPPRSS